MPFVLITVGVAIFITALNNTWKQFGAQVYKDMFGATGGGFVYWAAALVIVGFIGYIPQLKKPADFFLVLIIVGLLLKNKGFFQQLQQGLAGGASGGTSTGTTPTPNQYGVTPLNSSQIANLVLVPLQNLGNNATPLTTPAPASGGSTVPLGFGGIGSA
jgi:hypothetical protein